MNSFPSFNDPAHNKAQFSWLKVVGALAVLWLTAKVIGALLSPGVVILGLVLWLIVRSQRNKAAKPVVHFVPAPSAFASAPVPPAGYWMPAPSPASHPVGFAAAAPTARGAAHPMPVAPILDVRTPAEREIEEYVQRSWPNV